MTFEQIECTSLIFQNNCDNHSLSLNMIWPNCKCILELNLPIIQENNKVELEKCMIITYVSNHSLGGAHH